VNYKLVCAVFCGVWRMTQLTYQAVSLLQKVVCAFFSSVVGNYFCDNSNQPSYFYL